MSKSVIIFPNTKFIIQCKKNYKQTKLNTINGTPSIKIQKLEKLMFSVKNPYVTLKAQLLLRHAVPFATWYSFWSKSAKQSIKNLHKK